MKPAIPMTDKLAGEWRERITSAEHAVKKKLESWKDRQAAYIGLPLKDVPSEEVCMVNKDMPRVKQKIAQLFYQVPEIQLRPRRPEVAQAVAPFQAVINYKLTEELRVENMVDEVLTDVSAVSGIGIAKIGYEMSAQEVEVPTVSPDEAELLLAAGQPVPMTKAPVPVHESYFWKRISPAKFLFPSEFKGTDFDDAAWLGFTYRKPYGIAKAEYGLKDDSLTTQTDDKLVTDEKPGAGESPEKEIECVEIWYKAYIYDEKVKNPLRLRRLVFIEGEEQPVVHEDSPYQRFDEYGKFVMGMRKFPIRVLVLTTVPDEALPPSDTAITAPLTRELQESRTQMVKQRKRALPMRWYNASIVDPEVAEKLAAGDIQDMIPLNAPGDSAIGEVARANYPRETFEFQRVIEHDLMETWALGSNQLGADSPGEQSATEVRAIQGSTNVRLDYERAKVLRWFLDGVELLASLIQLFADETDYIEIVGQDYQRMLQAWNKDVIAGEFVFEAKTNSQLRLDVAQERMDARNAYQLLANEPFANRQKLVEWVAQTHDIDPAQFMVQPPPKQPEAPNVSFRFSGDDLNPLNPSFPIVLEVLAAGGFQLPPEVINQAKVQAAMMMATGGMPNMPTNAPKAPLQTQHGGPAKQAEPLSKNQAGDGDYR